MITVIIAEKEILNLFREYEIFLRPMMQSENYALCEWDKTGRNINEMLPTLYEIVEHHNEWRALVVNNDGLHQVNPFDFTQYSEPLFEKSKKLDWEWFGVRREERFRCYDRAINNPFTKLTTALCGMPVFDFTVQDPDTYSGIVSGEIPLYRFMLDSQLEALDLAEIAARMDLLQKEQLLRFTQEENVDELIEALRNHDSARLLELVDPELRIDFIQFIGNFDPQFSDPEYMECVVENTYKQKLFEALKKDFVLRDKLPQDVVCVAPRTFDVKHYEDNVKWEDKDESEYSRFAEFNLYPEKLRYLVFDIISRHNRQYTFDQMRMICFLLILAETPFPAGSVKAQRVYRANVDFNPDAVKKSCAEYLSKLKATSLHIKELGMQLQEEIVSNVDNATAQKLFESEERVMVEITGEFNRNLLRAKHDKIGLSKNCPGDEYVYWMDQVRAITKNFNRYLREPRRALQHTVRNDFVKKSKIDDVRVTVLTDRQREDVELHMLDQEEKMFEVKTPGFFKNRAYMERIEKADKVVRQGISHRMTKKKTVCTGLIALGSFLFGLLPLVFGNIRDVKTFLASLLILGVSMGVMTLTALLFIRRKRKKMISRIKRFNFEMGNILHEIDCGLADFSTYLSHACNVRRGFSVLTYTDKNKVTRENIIKKHLYDINCKIAEINALFYGYVDLSDVDISEVDPYEYDYTVLRDYEYEMPYLVSASKVRFVELGYTIDLPVDYVKSVTLTREELYD